LLDVRFGGREGRDVKMMLFPQAAKQYHYTLMMFTRPEDLSLGKIPIDLHKTWDGPPPTHHQSLAEGTFEMQPLIQTITQSGIPSVESIDLSSQRWRKREGIGLDRLLLTTLQTKTLSITPDWADLFTSKPISNLGSNTLLTAVAADEEGNEGGMVIQAENHAYFVRIPVLEMLDKLEGDMEESLSMIYLADLEDEFDNITGRKGEDFET
jgi:hypothetical protein